jgi:hypothetical protein
MHHKENNPQGQNQKEFSVWPHLCSYLFDVVLVFKKQGKELNLSSIPNLKSYEKDYNLTEYETLFHKHQRKIE